jgi:membrane-associated protein
MTPALVAHSAAAIHSGLLSPEGLMKDLGPWALLGACIILLVECGLLIGLVLPGDSLLFIVGLLLANGFISTPLALALFALSISAVAGNLLGYWTGVKVGPALFKRPDSRFFKQEYVAQTNAFFDKHGNRAIVLARFVPIVRSLITAVAGIARMDYKRFATYSAIGGVAWVFILTLAGYFLGGIEIIKNHIDLVTIGLVVLSTIPIYFEVRKQAKSL